MQKNALQLRVKTYKYEAKLQYKSVKSHIYRGMRNYWNLRYIYKIYKKVFNWRYKIKTKSLVFLIILQFPMFEKIWV